MITESKICAENSSKIFIRYNGKSLHQRPAPTSEEVRCELRIGVFYNIIEIIDRKSLETMNVEVLEGTYLMVSP